jgi:hypothetical protein
MLQLIAQHVLHRVVDDSFDTAPFRFHIVEGDAEGRGVRIALCYKFRCSVLAACAVGCREVFVYLIFKEVDSASAHQNNPKPNFAMAPRKITTASAR